MESFKFVQGFKAIFKNRSEVILLSPYIVEENNLCIE